MSDETDNSLIVIPTLTPAIIFAEKGGSQAVIDKIKEHIATIDLDISTEKGRKQVKSLAHKIARTKTALDEQGKILKADMQRTVDLIDAERKSIRDALDDLKQTVRQPLTDFENAEEARILNRENRLGEILMQSQNCESFSVESLDERIEILKGLYEYDWQEFVMRADKYYLDGINALQSAKEARIKYEKDQAELAELRAKEEARLKKEREDQIAKEAAETATKLAEAKAAADAQLAKEKADADAKLAQEKLDKANKEKVDADKATADAIEKAKQDAIKAEADKAEAVRVAEEKAKQDIQNEKLAEAKALEKREADKKHMSKINNEALLDMVNFIDPSMSKQEIAKAVITAIALRKIKNIQINY